MKIHSTANVRLRLSVVLQKHFGFGLGWKLLSRREHWQMQVAELCNLGSKLVAAEFSSAWKSVFAQGAENGKQFHGDQKCQSQLKKGGITDQQSAAKFFSKSFENQWHLRNLLSGDPSLPSLLQRETETTNDIYLCWFGENCGHILIPAIWERLDRLDESEQPCRTSVEHFHVFQFEAWFYGLWVEGDRVWH